VDFLFERSVVAAGGVVRRFRLDRNSNFSFDPEEISSLVTPRTRLLSVCNPHNPTGRVWSRAELEALAEVALRHDLAIMSDEVWADIVHPPHHLVSMAALGPEVSRRTFTVYGFSKGYSLAGLRLGALLCPSPEAAEQVIVLSHADETAYGVSALSQVAGQAALERAGPWLRRFLEHLRRQRDYAVERLNAIPGVSCNTPEATYVVFPKIEGWDRDTTELVDRLAEQARVVVVPGSPRFFGPAAAGHIRLSIATSRALLEAGLDRLEAGLRETLG
jgi:aspartate/methionine/tyrosine aminotransferase